MLNLTGATRIFLRAGATGLRLGFAGLHALVETQLHQDVLSGHVFVFCNRDRTRIKTLAWDGSGLWLCTKRLERGTFGWIKTADTEVAPAELQAMLAGLEIQAQRVWYRR
jgi:transposase